MASAGVICVVDDTADYRFILQQVFKRYFSAYTVKYFSGGQPFLEELAKMNPKPGLILLDHHMPVLNGYQTLLGLKGQAANRSIPVVMMSAEASAVEIQACLEAGANGFVAKKMNLEDLKADIATLCQDWLECPADSS